MQAGLDYLQTFPEPLHDVIAVRQMLRKLKKDLPSEARAPLQCCGHRMLLSVPGMLPSTNGRHDTLMSYLSLKAKPCDRLMLQQQSGRFICRAGRSAWGLPSLSGPIAAAAQSTYQACCSRRLIGSAAQADYSDMPRRVRQRTSAESDDEEAAAEQLLHRARQRFAPAADTQSTDSLALVPHQVRC